MGVGFVTQLIVGVRTTLIFYNTHAKGIYIYYIVIVIYLYTLAHAAVASHSISVLS